MRAKPIPTALKIIISVLFCLLFTGILSYPFLSQNTVFAKESKKTVRISKIEISNIPLDTITLEKGSTKTIKVKIYPAKAKKQKLVWKSSNPKIASVKKGIVTAKQDGTVKITAHAKGNKKVKTSLKVIVGVPVKKIITDVSSVKLASGTSERISAKTYPPTASVKKVTFKSSNKKIARVNKNGKITGKLAGKTKITILSNDSRRKKEIDINTYYITDNYTLKPGEKFNVKNIADHEWLKANKNITFSSTNPKIAKVSQDGTVTGKKKGKTTIILANGLKQLKINLTVGVPVSNIILNNNRSITMNTKYSVTLEKKIQPANASNKKLHYSSSNPEVLTVNSKGVIKGVSEGKAYVIVKSDDGRVATSVLVRVFSPHPLKVSTTDGKIMGTNPVNDISAWYDVPYAAPPVDDLRWKAPRDNIKWSGTLDTTQSSKIAAQYNNGEFIGDEDCLYLNISRPNTTEQNLPVLVYLHGGSNVHGSKNSFSPRKLVRQNVIVVTINYRLGAFGFFSMGALKTGNPEDDSGNFAILDIAKALEWIRDNIGNFGGDKNNVTLAGFSAGAKNVAACLISPRLSGLFHKAILLSGSANEATVEEAQTSAINGVAKILVNRGDFANTNVAINWLKNASSQEVRDILYNLSSEEVAKIFSSNFSKSNAIKYAIKDGYVIPYEGFNIIKTGNYNNVPVILGSCSNEYAGFLLSDGIFAGSTDAETLLFDTEKAQLASTALYYSNMLYAGYNVEYMASVLYNSPNPSTVYAYRFFWGSNADVTGEKYFSEYVGAHHGMDIDFIEGIWGNNYSSIAPNLFNQENLAGRLALSNNMVQYFVNFIYTSNPNSEDMKTWEPLSASNQRIMRFDASKTDDTSKMMNTYYNPQLLWQMAYNDLGEEFIIEYFSKKFFWIFRNLFYTVY